MNDVLAPRLKHKNTTDMTTFQKEFSKIRAAHETKATIEINITGKRVQGKITTIKVTEHGIDFTVKHEPVRWGDNTYTEAHSFLRADGHKMYSINFNDNIRA